MFKKGEGCSKNDYIQGSILPNEYKILEKWIFCEMSLCGWIFKQNSSEVTERDIRRLKCAWQMKISCQQNNINALLIHLSMAFDCLLHDLLLAKFSFSVFKPI